MALRAGPSRDNTVEVDGLRETQRALKRFDADAAKGLRSDLRDAGKEVADDAKAGVRSRSGGLAKSIRTSVTATGASVYSNKDYARVQDQGGRVGRGHSTLLRRGDVTEYMTRAWRAAEPRVVRRVERMLDRIERDFGGRI